MLAVAPIAAGQLLDTGGPQVEDSVNGERAVRRLGTELPAVAAAHEFTAVELTDLLQRDESLWVTPGGRLFHGCFGDHVHALEGAAGAGSTGGATADGAILVPAGCSSPAEIALEDTFALASMPSATKTIYLDFDGHHSVDTGWGHDIVFPPYNIEGSPSSFTDNELREIQGIWWRVVEDFASFNVNVTTTDPGIAALTKSNPSDDTYGVRCVMTQATDGFGAGIGGVAYLNSFADAIDTPVFGFNKGINNGSMTASHEVGHALGLTHDGLFGQTYHPGSGSGETGWGPIMGAPFGHNVVRWSNGDYDGATNEQDDLLIITRETNGLDYREDDFADGLDGIGPIESGLSVDGLIASNTDVDAFEFTTAGGAVTIEAHPLDPGPNLDARIKLGTIDGVGVTFANPANDVDALLEVELSAGTYVIRLHGTGNPGVYSSYGSIGQYCLTATYTPAGECPPDLDGDGVVAVSDLLIVLGAWGMEAGDVTGDGTTDVADLLAVLSAWGAC